MQKLKNECNKCNKPRSSWYKNKDPWYKYNISTAPCDIKESL